MALANDQSLIDLANDLDINYELTFKQSVLASTPELDKAINAIYEQIPFDMKMDTRDVIALSKLSSPKSIAHELLADLPRLVLDSDLSPRKKRILLTSISELYRRFFS